MLFKFFKNPQTSMFSAAITISSMVALSRVFGLIRNRLLTDTFTPAQLDPYFAAFRLPNLIFEVLVMGALSVAFIPIFTQYVTTNRKKQAFEIASQVINFAFISSFVFTLIFVIFTPWITKLITPGLSGEDLKLMISFTRIILIFQVIPLVIGNILTGFLQSFKRFFIPALAPVLYNIGIIIGIIFLSPYYGLNGAVYGVVIGAVLFCIVQIPFVYSLGYHHNFKFDFKNKGLRSVGKLMGPRVIGVSAMQIDATIDVILASLIGAGSITIFSLAQQLQLVPLMLFGLPIAQAALPLLSELAVHKKLPEFKFSLLTALDQALFFIMPASAFLIVMKIPVVRLVYGADQFDWVSTVLTARTMAFFAFSLPAQIVIMLFARAFFAFNDSKTPLILTLISTGLNTSLSIYFVVFLKLPVWSLGISASIAAITHAVLLLFALDKRVARFDRNELFIPVIKIALCTLVMSLCLYIPLKLLDQLVFDTTKTVNLLLLTFTASCIGLATYLFFAWFLNIKEVGLFYMLAKRLVSIRTLLVDTSFEVVDEKSG